MLALGIDPGTAICGYGLVEMKGSSLRPVFYGAVLTDKDWKPEDRLKQIHDDVADIIRHFSPEFMSIEKLYFNRNVNTAIPVAQARGAAGGGGTAAAHCGIYADADQKGGDRYRRRR